jgi:hypothetical protein
MCLLRRPALSTGDTVRNLSLKIAVSNTTLLIRIIKHTVFVPESPLLGRRLSFVIQWTWFVTVGTN